MKADFRLDGKHILVTGASSGIGRQVALSLSQSGAAVTITGRDEARLAETFASLAPQHSHRQVAGDLREDATIAQLVDGGKPLDGVVHAAGMNGPAPVKMVSRSFVNERLQANYMAPLMLTQRILVKNALKNGGSILFIASISAHTGTAGMSIYSATKASLVATAKCMALELARKKIRVNCLSPAIVRTPFFRPDEQEWLNETEKRYPLGLGQPQDVANAAIFMLADASRWITGQSLIMDGACPWI